MAVAPTQTQQLEVTPSQRVYYERGDSKPLDYRDPLTVVTQQIATAYFPRERQQISNFAEHPAAVQTTQGTNVGAPAVPSSPLDPELGGGVSGEEIQGGPVFRGALGSTIQAARSISPFAVLLIVGGLALLGYWAYTKYGGRLGL